MLNITHYQRNANQNHNEVPLHTSQMTAIQKYIIFWNSFKIIIFL